MTCLTFLQLSILTLSSWKIKTGLLKFKNRFEVWEDKNRNILMRLKWYTNMVKNSLICLRSLVRQSPFYKIKTNKCKAKNRLIILFIFLNFANKSSHSSLNYCQNTERILDRECKNTRNRSKPLTNKLKKPTKRSIVLLIIFILYSFMKAALTVDIIIAIYTISKKRNGESITTSTSLKKFRSKFSRKAKVLMPQAHIILYMLKMMSFYLQIWKVPN